MVAIIIKDRPHRFGKTRTEQSKNLHSEGWGTGFKKEVDIDKARFLERRGVKFPTASQIEGVK